MTTLRLAVLRVCAAACIISVNTICLLADQPPEKQIASKTAIPSADSGRDLYQAACATCHGEDGRGSSRAVVGFDAPLPDFTDCAFATAEPDPDWHAVVHEGGPVRGLDRHMPAFGDALSTADIDHVVRYLRTFCAEPAWPRGDLNFPRAFVTEKAFPENETVWTTAVAGDPSRSVEIELLFERRLGARSQLEFKAPVALQQDEHGRWNRGLGDIAFGLKHALHADVESGRIVSLGGEIVVPTGKEYEGLGNGVAVVEAFLAAGQAIGRASFVQFQAGMEVPLDRTTVRNEGFWRMALGSTLAQDRGFGRAWTPMLEAVVAWPSGEAAEVDVVPQLQVTLSKLQHVMISAGVRAPVTARQDRPMQFVTYLLWDWFDGPFFDFWR